MVVSESIIGLPRNKLTYQNILTTRMPFKFPPLPSGLPFQSGFGCFLITKADYAYPESWHACVPCIIISVVEWLCYYVARSFSKASIRIMAIAIAIYCAFTLILRGD